MKKGFFAWLLATCLVAVPLYADDFSDLDALRYIASYGDLIEAFGADPAKGRWHYENWGIKEGRKITFEPSRYMASHADLIAAFKGDEERATRHYINWGYKEKRSTTSFDPLAYIASYADLIAAFATDAIAGAKHYIYWGYQEGRRIIFDALAYLAQHADVRAAFGNDVSAAAKHYIQFGYSEGRSFGRFALSGFVAGLGNDLVLTLELADRQLRLTGNGKFRFEGALLPNSAYKLTVVGSPAGQTCTLVNAEGFAASEVTGVDITCEYDQPFVAESQSFPSLDRHFDELCGPTRIERNTQGAAAIDMDGDGLKEIILNIWCAPYDRGEGQPVRDHAEPTPSRILVFKHRPDGSFVESTESYLGSSVIDVGGVGEYHVIGDFNRDGYNDVIFAVQREDGRLIGTPAETIKALNFALMSRAAGRYDAVPWGYKEWHAELYLVDNASGGQDVLETSFTRETQGWAWDREWKTVSGYEWVSGGAAFFNRRAPGVGSETAIVSFINDRVGVEARKRSGNEWVRAGEFSYPNTPIKKICCGQEKENNANFVQIDSIDYIDPSFSFLCALRRTPTSEPEAIINFNAYEIVGGYNGTTVIYGKTELKGFDRLMAFGFDADQNLKRNTLVISNEFTENSKANRMSCGDYNADGYDDIVLYRTFGKNTPIIYLNDRDGSFSRVAESIFPAATDEFRVQHNYTIVDLNADGLQDIIYYPIVSERGRLTRVTVHLGQRSLRQSDLL